MPESPPLFLTFDEAQRLGEAPSPEVVEPPSFLGFQEAKKEDSGKKEEEGEDLFEGLLAPEEILPFLKARTASLSRAFSDKEKQARFSAAFQALPNVPPEDFSKLKRFTDIYGMARRAVAEGSSRVPALIRFIPSSMMGITPGGRREILTRFGESIGDPEAFIRRLSPKERDIFRLAVKDVLEALSPKERSGLSKASERFSGAIRRMEINLDSIFKEFIPIFGEDERDRLDLVKGMEAAHRLYDPARGENFITEGLLLAVENAPMMAGMLAAQLTPLGIPLATSFVASQTVPELWDKLRGAGAPPAWGRFGALLGGSLMAGIEMIVSPTRFAGLEGGRKIVENRLLNLLLNRMGVSAGELSEELLQSITSDASNLLFAGKLTAEETRNFAKNFPEMMVSILAMTAPGTVVEGLGARLDQLEKEGRDPTSRKGAKEAGYRTPKDSSEARKAVVDSVRSYTSTGPGNVTESLFVRGEGTPTGMSFRPGPSVFERVEGVEERAAGREERVEQDPTPTEVQMLHNLGLEPSLDRVRQLRRVREGELREGEVAEAMQSPPEVLPEVTDPGLLETLRLQMQSEEDARKAEGIPEEPFLHPKKKIPSLQVPPGEHATELLGKEFGEKLGRVPVGSILKALSVPSLVRLSRSIGREKMDLLLQDYSKGIRDLSLKELRSLAEELGIRFRKGDTRKKLLEKVSGITSEATTLSPALFDVPPEKLLGPAPPPSGLEMMTLRELREVAAELGMEVPPKVRRGDLISSIEAEKRSGSSRIIRDRAESRRRERIREFQEEVKRASTEGPPPTPETRKVPTQEKLREIPPPEDSLKDSGSRTVSGEDLRKKTPKQVRKIARGMNVKEGPKVRKRQESILLTLIREVPRERIPEVVEKLGLKPEEGHAKQKAIKSLLDTFRAGSLDFQRTVSTLRGMSRVLIPQSFVEKQLSLAEKEDLKSQIVEQSSTPDGVVSQIGPEESKKSNVRKRAEAALQDFNNQMDSYAKNRGGSVTLGSTRFIDPAALRDAIRLVGSAVRVGYTHFDAFAQEVQRNMGKSGMAENLRVLEAAWRSFHSNPQGKPDEAVQKEAQKLAGIVHRVLDKGAKLQESRVAALEASARLSTPELLDSEKKKILDLVRTRGTHLGKGTVDSVVAEKLLLNEIDRYAKTGDLDLESLFWLTYGTRPIGEAARGRKVALADETTEQRRSRMLFKALLRIAPFEDASLQRAFARGDASKIKRFVDRRVRKAREDVAELSRRGTDLRSLLRPTSRGLPLSSERRFYETAKNINTEVSSGRTFLERFFNGIWEVWAQLILMRTLSTQARNFVGGFLNPLWKNTVDTFFEASVGLAAKDADKRKIARMGDFRYFSGRFLPVSRREARRRAFGIREKVRERGIVDRDEMRAMLSANLPGFNIAMMNSLRAFKMEAPQLGQHLGLATAVSHQGERAFALRGPLGRVIRLGGFTALQTVDEFNKGLWFPPVLHTEAARIARSEGLSLRGDEFQKRVGELILDIESEAWERALHLANEAQFQTRSNVPAHTFWQWSARNGVQHVAQGLRRFLPLKFEIPFHVTLANALYQTIRRTPGIGAMDLIGEYAHAQETGNYSAVANLIGQQIQGIIAVGAMMLMMAHDDDDQGRPAITGTLGVGSTPGERQFQQRTNMPPRSIRLGDVVLEYGHKLPAPIGTTISAWADIATMIRKGKASEVPEDLLNVAVEGLRSETYMMSMMDLAEVLSQPPNRRMDAALEHAMGIAGGFVPPFYSGVKQARDPKVRLRRVWGQRGERHRKALERYRESIVGFSENPPRYTLWGDEIEKLGPSSLGVGGPRTDFFWHLTDLLRIRNGEKIFVGDTLLGKWNLKQPEDNQFYPEEPAPFFLHPDTGKKVAMTDEQYSDFMRVSGRISRGAVQQTSPKDPMNPEQSDFETVTQIIQNARDTFRDKAVPEWVSGRPTPRIDTEGEASTLARKIYRINMDRLSFNPIKMSAEERKRREEDGRQALQWLRRRGYDKESALAFYEELLQEQVQEYIQSKADRFSRRGISPRTMVLRLGMFSRFWNSFGG